MSHANAHRRIDRPFPFLYGATRGELNPQSRLTAKCIRAIRRRRAGGESFQTIAVAFEITPTHVRSIVRGACWRSVTTETKGGQR